MSNIQLKDMEGNILYPITNSNAVKFTDGKNLDEKLESIKVSASWDSIEGKPSNLATINDSSNNTTDTWSSSKIKSQLDNKAQIMDGNESNQFTWSGEYIANNYSPYGHTHAGYASSSHSHALNDMSGMLSTSKISTATTSSEGVVTLTDSVSSTSSGYAASASAVKTAYDKAVSAYNLANHSHPYASSSHTHSNYASSSHTHSGYLSTSSKTYFLTGSHDPYSTDSYNLGYSSKRWNQCCAKYGYFTNTYSLAVDVPYSTANDVSLNGIIDSVIIESPDVKRMNDNNFTNKLIFNINALKQSPNAHLFVSEDDGGNPVINESSMLALCIKEIQNINYLNKELTERINEIENLLKK